MAGVGGTEREKARKKGGLWACWRVWRPMDSAISPAAAQMDVGVGDGVEEC